MMRVLVGVSGRAHVLWSAVSITLTLAATLTITAQAATAVEANNYVEPTGQALPIYAYTPNGYSTEGYLSGAEIAALSATDPASTQTLHHHPTAQQNASQAASKFIGNDSPDGKSHGLVRGSTATPGQQIQMAGQPAPATGTPQQAAALQQRTHGLTQFIKNYNKRLTWEQANAIAEAIIEFSGKYKVDFRIVTGVIAVESGFRSNAVSSSGAIGMGQLKPATARWLGVANPFDPIDNIAGSCRYIGYLLKKYNGNVDRALAAYFQGPGATDRNGITSQSRYYLLKVNRALAPLVPMFR